MTNHWVPQDEAVEICSTILALYVPRWWATEWIIEEAKAFTRGHSYVIRMAEAISGHWVNQPGRRDAVYEQEFYSAPDRAT